MAAIVIEVDGSARFNPGPAGIGVRVVEPGGRVLKEISRYIGNRTNNQAEYEAMLCGLEQALALPPQEVLIQTDSALVYNQLTNRFRVKDADLKPLYTRCTQLLSRLPNAVLKLVPRRENRYADKLAQSARGATIANIRTT